MKLNAIPITLGALVALLAMPVMGHAEELVVPHEARAGESISPWVDAASKYDLEPLTLYALAFAESRRRRPNGTLTPWPWTLNTPSKGGMYFDTYEAAVAALRQLLAEGTTNIDIGLMGINWFWNGHRLPDPEKLLLPENNIQVAAGIFRELLDRFDGDRRLAFAHYHSARSERGIPYAESVLTIVDRLSRLDGIQLALTRPQKIN